jgi:hypothetical protein
MKLPAERTPFGTYHPLQFESDRPTGPCVCPPADRHHHDSPSSRYGVTCLACGNHWWEENRCVVEGPPFSPYTSTLALIDPKGYGLIEAKRRARYRPNPTGLVDRFRWWFDSSLNPLLSDALNASGISAAEAKRVWRLHRREIARVCYEAGDLEAIFECVVEDPDAYDDIWVRVARADWGRDGSPAAIRRLNRLLRARSVEKRKRSGRPPGVPWGTVVRDIENFLKMKAFNAEKILAAVTHAGLRQSTGYRIRHEYTAFVRTFKDTVGSEQGCCDFLRLLISPRPEPKPL